MWILASKSAREEAECTTHMHHSIVQWLTLMGLPGWIFPARQVYPKLLHNVGYMFRYNCFLLSRFKMTDIVVSVKYMECCNPSLTMIVEPMCNTSWQCSNICLSNIMWWNFWCPSMEFFALTLGNCNLSTVWVVVARSLGIQEMSALQNHNLLL
jgi:hypothetical protein